MEDSISWVRPESRRADEIYAIAASAFLKHGFHGVALRALAESMGLKAATLYHHCPGGKVELYRRSVRSRLLNIRGSLMDALEDDVSLCQNIETLANRLLSQPGIDLQRIVDDDCLSIGDSDLAEELSDLSQDAIHDPFLRAFLLGQTNGEIRGDVSTTALADATVAILMSVSRRQDLDEITREAENQSALHSTRILLRGAMTGFVEV